LITGSSGFVGKNVLNRLNAYTFIKSTREAININICHEVVLHLAAKTHDLIHSDAPGDYYLVNTELTKKVFDNFLISGAKVFIILSSVKAAADVFEGELTEEHIPNPITHYGKSKLLAEQYILSKKIPNGKRFYILRPCMIHGPGNKGNLNLLYKIVSYGIPWPLGAFKNKRSFCSIDNLIFVINQLIQRDDIPSGVYNVADDLPLSTNEIIPIIAESLNRKLAIWNIPKMLIHFFATLGDVLKLPLNKERLQKLTDCYIVSNKKIVTAIGRPLPVSSRDGLLKTFKSFQ